MSDHTPDINDLENWTDEEWEAFEKQSSEADLHEESVWFRRRINRVFRERGGIKEIPHPEVDTAYERIRSRIVRFFLVIADKIKKIFS